MRILLLSPWAPPAQRPQAYLAGKLLEHFGELGIHTSLITSDQTPDYPDVETHTTGSHDGILPRIRGRFARALFSDPFTRTKIKYRNLLGKAEQVIKQAQPDLVVSFANPYSANVLGLLIARSSGLPFIAHYSDPFSMHPWQQVTQSQTDARLAVENQILNEANAVVFVSDILRDFVASTSDSDTSAKSHVIPHSYDPDQYGDSQPQIAPLVIRHMGSLFSERSPETFLEAVRTLKQNHPNLEQELKVEFYGADSSYSAEDSTTQLIATMGLESVAKTLQTVPYSDSLKLMKSAGALVSIGSAKEAAVFLPSKLVDYLGAKRPLLILSQQNSPAWQLGEKCGAIWADVSNPIQIAEALDQILKSTNSAVPTSEEIEAYSIREVTQQWSKLFTSVVESARI